MTANRPANPLTGKRLLLTGERGFIGSSLLEELQRQGCAVSTIPGDVAAPEAWLAVTEDFDFVLHLAAVEHDPSFERELAVNALAVLHLARRIASLKKKPGVIFTSSNNIWGGRTTSIVDEQTADAPASIWSTHKLLAENYLRAFREFGVQSVILRLPNISGLCANKGAITRSAVNRAIARCVLDKTLTVYANKDCLRDYLDVSDLVAMVLQTLLCFDEMSGHAKVIIGSGRCVPIIDVWTEIARQYQALTGEKIEVQEKTSVLSAFAMRSCVTNTALASRILGYRPKLSIEESIRATMQHMIAAQNETPKAPFAETVDG